MKKENINLSAQAIDAIKGLQHAAGTFEYYDSTLGRLSRFILHASDEMGMDSMEALSTLRVLDAIRADLKAISGLDTASEETTNDTDEDIDE